MYKKNSNIKRKKRPDVVCKIYDRVCMDAKEEGIDVKYINCEGCPIYKEYVKKQ